MINNDYLNQLSFSKAIHEFKENITYFQEILIKNKFFFI